MSEIKLPARKARDAARARPVGRPPRNGVRGCRYQVYLPIETAKRLRHYGGGSLSKGIQTIAGWVDPLLAARAPGTPASMPVLGKRRSQTV